MTLCGCVCRADGLLVCFGAKPKQRAWARDLLRERKWMSRWRCQKRRRWFDKGRRREELTTEGRGERSALSWLSRKWQNQQKSERRLLRADELRRGRVNQRENMSALLVPFVEVSCKIRAGDSLRMHGEYRVTQNSLSYAWNIPKSMLFVCSSFHPLGCILCGRCEMWNTTRWITGHK